MPASALDPTSLRPPAKAPASAPVPVGSPPASRPSPLGDPDITNRESKYYDPVKDKIIEEPARGSAPGPSIAATGLAARARAPAPILVGAPVGAGAPPAHLGTNRTPVEDPTFIVSALPGFTAAALSLDASPHEDQIALSRHLVDKFYAQKSELALKWSKRP